MVVVRLKILYALESAPAPDPTPAPVHAPACAPPASGPERSVEELAESVWQSGFEFFCMFCGQYSEEQCRCDVRSLKEVKGSTDIIRLSKPFDASCNPGYND